MNFTTKVINLKYGKDELKLDLVFIDGIPWFSKKQIAEIFQKEIDEIKRDLKLLIKTNEFDLKEDLRKQLLDGKMVKLYSLHMILILARMYKVDSPILNHLEAYQQAHKESESKFVKVLANPVNIVVFLAFPILIYTLTQWAFYYSHGTTHLYESMLDKSFTWPVFAMPKFFWIIEALVIALLLLRLLFHKKVSVKFCLGITSISVIYIVSSFLATGGGYPAHIFIVFFLLTVIAPLMILAANRIPKTLNNGVSISLLVIFLIPLFSIQTGARMAQPENSSYILAKHIKDFDIKIYSSEVNEIQKREEVQFKTGLDKPKDKELKLLFIKRHKGYFYLKYEKGNKIIKVHENQIPIYSVEELD